MWTDLSSAFGYGTKLTSTQQGQLRDNAIYCYDFIASGSLTNHGILLGSGTNPITPTAVMSDGQILIGQSAADPLPKTMSGEATISKTGVVSLTPTAGSINQTDIGNAAIGTGELKTATEIETYNFTSQAWAKLTWSSIGEYGFDPQFKTNDAGVGLDSAGQIVWFNNGVVGIIDTTYRTTISVAGKGCLFSAQIRYVTASGEYGWFFFLQDKTTKELLRGHYSDDHPSINDSGLEHPFFDAYDAGKHNLICVVMDADEINDLEVEAVHKKTCIMHLVWKEYELSDENVRQYPTESITLGLPKTIMINLKDEEGKITGQKEIVPSYRTMPIGTKIQSIKKVVVKPNYVICKSLKKKDK